MCDSYENTILISKNKIFISRKILILYVEFNVAHGGALIIVKITFWCNLRRISWSNTCRTHQET